jgi:hypothetical protein
MIVTILEQIEGERQMAENRERRAEGGEQRARSRERRAERARSRELKMQCEKYCFLWLGQL